MKKLTLLVFLLFINLGFAQDGKIEGIVMDGELNNEPLAFANVSIKESNQIIVTDLDGKYSVEIEPGTYTLVFNFIGYEPLEVQNVVVEENKIFKMSEALHAKQYAVEEKVAFKG